MYLNKIITVVSLLLLITFPHSVLSQETTDEKPLKKAAEEITFFADLIEQVNSEKKEAKGTEARALTKQLLLIQEIYRSLLWNFAGDVTTGPKLTHPPMIN